MSLSINGTFEVWSVFGGCASVFLFLLCDQGFVV